MTLTPDERQLLDRLQRVGRSGFVTAGPSREVALRLRSRGLVAPCNGQHVTFRITKSGTTALERAMTDESHVPTQAAPITVTESTDDELLAALQAARSKSYSAMEAADFSRLLVLAGEAPIASRGNVMIDPEMAARLAARIEERRAAERGVVRERWQVDLCGDRAVAFELLSRGDEWIWECEGERPDSWSMQGEAFRAALDYIGMRFDTRFERVSPTDTATHALSVDEIRTLLRIEMAESCFPNLGPSAARSSLILSGLVRITSTGSCYGTTKAGRELLARLELL